MRDFHLSKGKARMCLKIDLNKAVDSVRWDFLEETMRSFNLPAPFINWILQCVTKPLFSILVNGASTGYFSSKRGLRQGCPLTPYLFSIIMEHFSANMKACASNGLISSPYVASDITVSYLFFADDLMLFFDASPWAAGNIKKLLDDFNCFAGLGANLGKSRIFFSNCNPETKFEISAIMGFQVQILPVKYLGLSLFSNRLTCMECQPLVDKVRVKLAGWKSHLLSFTSTLNLIKFTINALHLFWASSFLIPQSCLEELDRIVRNFFWGSFECNEKNLKPIAWKHICRPLDSGFWEKIYY